MKTMFFSLMQTSPSLSVHSQSAQLQTVFMNYDRFGKGDIPGIISSLDAKVHWTHPGNPDIVPFAGTFDGIDGVGRFFQTMAKVNQITVFQPSDFQENGNAVSNKVHIEGLIPATGKSYVSDVVFTWTFGENGKITDWKAEGDVTSLEAALAGN